MKRISVFLFCLFLAMSCQRDYGNITSPSKLLPFETQSVIVVNELNDFVNSIKNHDILSDIYNKELKTTIPLLKNINTNKQVHIAFLNDNNSDFLILAEHDSTLLVLDSIPNHVSENLASLTIEKTQIDSLVFFQRTLNNVFAASNNQKVMENLNSKNQNNTLMELLETTGKKSVASVIFKSTSSNYSKLLFTDADEIKGENFSVLDLNYSDNNLQFNGISKSKDSVLHKIDCFKNTIPQKTSALDITPSSVKAFTSITYDDFSIFNKNLHRYRTQELDSTQTFLNFTNEAALTDKAIILHALDVDLVKEAIENKSFEETYRDIDLYAFEKPDFFENRLKPFITFNNANYFFYYDDFIIFSNSSENLKSIIVDVLNNNTLANSDAFSNIDENLSDESSYFIYKNSKSLSQFLDNDLTGYNANAVQFVYEDDYAHINGIIQKFKKPRATNSVTESVSITLEQALVAPPQTVKNHVTGAHDVVAQDIGNTLYLISSSGSILWKKQIQGKVLGKIEQIDMYKNGRLQLAFATSNRLYVLDRNGNDVSPFPLKFNDDITQPLSVFDYDSNKNYRLLVTQGKNLLMYDDRGKSVTGFKYKDNGTDITSQPKHFRLGSKDYIAFKAGEKLQILSRQGNIRINVKDNINFSDNDLYLYKNKFTTTNSLGQLVQVDTKGGVNIQNLNLPEKHQIETTSKTLVSMTENKLKIKSRTVDLDYGEYTAPRIFYLNDKIYVSTTDKQAKKIYLFDSQAKAIPNFPVFGTAAAELQKLDKEQGLELVTQADNKTIVVYKIH